jgi:hypothetical protein
VLDGEYVLPTPDGAVKVRLAPQVSVGALAVGEAVVSVKQGHPVILVWNQHPYVLQSVLYDEWVYPTGDRRLQVRELRLLDPAAGAGEKPVVFNADSDDSSAISGILSINVVYCPMNTITCR